MYIGISICGIFELLGKYFVFMRPIEFRGTYVRKRETGKEGAVGEGGEGGGGMGDKGMRFGARRRRPTGSSGGFGVFQLSLAHQARSSLAERWAAAGWPRRHWCRSHAALVQSLQREPRGSRRRSPCSTCSAASVAAALPHQLRIHR